MSTEPQVGIYTLLIREHHLDTFGHMNNATYLEILEEARWELIHSRGYGMNYIHQVKKGPVILDVHLKFLKELKLRDEVKITTRVLDYSGKVGRLQQDILNQKNEVATTAMFTFALFDLQNRKLIDPTPEWLHAIGLS